MTEPAETVERGALRLELGFEFLQEAVYPLTGLEGDLTRAGVLGVRLGVADNVELQVLGTIQDFLSVQDRFEAPLSGMLDFSGNSTNEVGDFTIATKIRINRESEAFPTLGFRFGMELPNASNESGLGTDTTNVFGLLLMEKTLGRLQVLGNAGITILGDPLQAGSQDDLFLFGLAARFAPRPRFHLVSELSGRAGPGGIGTDNQSRIRAGVQLEAGGVYWDVAGFWGLADADASTGLILGISKQFKLF